MIYLKETIEATALRVVLGVLVGVAVIVGTGWLLVGCGGGSSSGGKGAACVAPSGEWDLELKSSDPECGSQKLDAVELAKLDESDGCVLTSQDFDDDGCVYMQRAACDGYSVTLVLTLNDGGTKIAEGTSTVEADDGTACDFDVTGGK